MGSTALGQNPRNRLDGSIGAGLLQLNVSNPSTDFKIGNTTNFNLQAEKPFGNSPLYLSVGFNYFKSTGQLNYSYTSPQATYTQANANFTADDFTLNLGLRVKFFEASIIKPYIEAGGLGGYMQLSYSNLNSSAFSSLGSDYKTVDNTLEFGYYGEAGLEFQPDANWGLRLGYHYLSSTTRAIATLKNQNLNYTGNLYYAGLFWHF
jgi:opacity protein-like surface antigen